MNNDDSMVLWLVYILFGCGRGFCAMTTPLLINLMAYLHVCVTANDATTVTITISTYIHHLN